MNGLNIFITLAGCVVFGLAGGFLYRNPVKVLDALTKDYELQHGPVMIGFFRFFGAAIVALAVLTGTISVVFAVAAATLKTLH